MEQLLMAFIALFVAVDPIGIIPIFFNLTHGLSETDRKKISFESIWAALILAFSFISLGKAVFHFLGITIEDFMIAGGIILLCLALQDLLMPGKSRRRPEDKIGVVPIGIPLMVGPAVLTTSVLCVDQYGLLATLLAVTANILLTGIFFNYSTQMMKWIGETGSNAISRVVSLLMAAIAVMMIRKGIGF
jgi:multiple antibiotic resistance protein